DHSPGFVGRTVVDENELSGAIELVENGRCPGDEPGQGGGLVEGRRDDAQLHSFHLPLGRARGIRPTSYCRRSIGQVRHSAGMGGQFPPLGRVPCPKAPVPSDQVVIAELDLPARAVGSARLTRWAAQLLLPLTLFAVAVLVE